VEKEAVTWGVAKKHQRGQDQRKKVISTYVGGDEDPFKLKKNRKKQRRVCGEKSKGVR